MQFKNTAYPIIIDKGWEASLSKIPSNIFLKKALIISDTNVGPLYSNEIIKALSENDIGIRTILIDPGESSKTIEKAMDIYTTALNFRMDRDSLFIALGGGVVGDLAGLTASTI